MHVGGGGWGRRGGEVSGCSTKRRIREESFSRGGEREFLVWMMIDRGGWNDGSKVEGVVEPKGDR